MTARLDACFTACRDKNRAALVTFVTAGDPDILTSQSIFNGLPEAGADIIELGVPFTDPMADGLAIQRAGQRALKGGQTLARTLEMVRTFRIANNHTPIILMGYYNPIYVYGVERFLAEAVSSGVDGLIVVDLPPEEDAELCLPTREAGLSFVRLATPTTNAARLPTVLQHASGFIYYVSVTGITGAGHVDFSGVNEQVRHLKQQTDLPVVVGFGVKTAQDVALLAQSADGVVVGSALVDTVRLSLDDQGSATSQTVEQVHALVRELAKGLHRTSQAA